MYQAVENETTVDSPCYTIAISSGKGGVGKSNIVANLALLLGSRGKQVIVLDADLGMANLDVIFGVRPRYTLHHVVQGRKRLQEIVTSVTDKVKLLAGGSGISNLADIPDKVRHDILQTLGQLRQYADILMIDTGAGLCSNVIGFLQSADEVLLVSTPEPTSMADAYGVIKTLAGSAEKFPKVSVVVNRAASSMEAFGVSSRLTTVARQFLEVEVHYKGFILEDESVSRSVRSQKPFTQIYPDSKASLCLRKIADAYAGAQEQSSRRSSQGFLGSLLSLFARGR
jgi:flagellar biosynthesis protein FlhG